jgi:hypothetical protein
MGWDANRSRKGGIVQEFESSSGEYEMMEPSGGGLGRTLAGTLIPALVSAALGFLGGMVLGKKRGEARGLAAGIALGRLEATNAVSAPPRWRRFWRHAA